MQTLKLNGWLGAHLRNRLLYCLESILLPHTEYLSLRKQISEICPIDPSHPLYKTFAGGFPKGYSLKVQSLEYISDSYNITSGSPIYFSIILIGKNSEYSSLLIDGINLFANKGIRGVCFTATIRGVESFMLRDFLEVPHCSNLLQLDIKTPLLLFKAEGKSAQGSFQARSNGMPSLYQIVYSAANRLASLSTLYGGIDWDDEIIAAINEISELAASPQIAVCDIANVELASANRVSDNRVMKFRGIVGRISWSGDIVPLLPLLVFCSKISLGNDTVYGMGDFEVNF